MSARWLMLMTVGWMSWASAQAPGPTWNEANAEKTLALSLRGDAARGAEAFTICQGCHRAGALGRADGSYPRLAGQHATVLIKQITDVRAGRRDNPKMLPFADEHELTPAGIADIAAYLQGLPVPATQGQGPGDDLARGGRRYAQDCAQCHGERGEGDGPRFFPRLSGQHFKYLLRESLMIRDGKRRNANPDMVKAIGAYSDDEIAAVADYISRLPLEAR